MAMIASDGRFLNPAVPALWRGGPRTRERFGKPANSGAVMVVIMETPRSRRLILGCRETHPTFGGLMSHPGFDGDDLAWV